MAGRKSTFAGQCFYVVCGVGFCFVNRACFGMLRAEGVKDYLYVYNNHQEWSRRSLLAIQESKNTLNPDGAAITHASARIRGGERAFARCKPCVG